MNFRFSHSLNSLFSKGEKPYKCPVDGCGKGFTCSKQLKVHSRTHTGEKPYHCDICDRDFGYNHVLKLHRVQHYGAKCYKCTICDETFKSKKEMEAHIKGHANEMPDDDENEVAESTNRNDVKMRTSPTSTMPAPLISPNSTITTTISTPLIATPRESSNSDGHSDVDEIAYYNSYSQSNASGTGYLIPSGGGVNPALLAAVSIAASAKDSDDLTALGRSHQRNGLSTLPSTSAGTSSLAAVVNEQDINNSFVYEPFAVMRHQGLFNPVPKVEEFR